MGVFRSEGSRRSLGHGEKALSIVGRRALEGISDQGSVHLAEDDGAVRMTLLVQSS